MAIESEITFFSGDDVELFYAVEDADNPPNRKNLTGALEIAFAVSVTEGGTPALLRSKTTHPLQVVVTDAVQGEFNVVLPKADTEGLSPKHKYHEAVVKDAAGKTARVAFGTAAIRKNAIEVA